MYIILNILLNIYYIYMLFFACLFCTYKFSLWTRRYPMLRIRGYCLGQAGIETGRSFLNKVYRQAVIITDGNLQERNRNREWERERQEFKARERYRQCVCVWEGGRQQHLFYAKNNIFKLKTTQNTTQHDTDTCSLCTVGAKWPQLLHLM